MYLGYFKQKMKSKYFVYQVSHNVVINVLCLETTFKVCFDFKLDANKSNVSNFKMVGRFCVNKINH